MDPSNRQQRLQMRQRGAGTRQINPVDFGFSFSPVETRLSSDPAPRRSARNTPQQPHASQTRESRPPLTARGAASRRRSMTPSKPPNQPDTNAAEVWTQGSMASLVSRARPDIYDGPDEGPDTRSRKRRKVSSEREITQLATPATSQVSVPSLLQKRLSSGGQSGACPIQIAQGPGRLRSQSVVQSQEATAWIDPVADKENTAPETHIFEKPWSAKSNSVPHPTISNQSEDRALSSRSATQDTENISVLSATGDGVSDDEVLVAVLEDSEGGSVADGQENVSLMTATEEWPDSTMDVVAVLDDTTMNGDDGVYNDVACSTLPDQGQPETPAPTSANIKRKRSLFKTPAQPPSDSRASNTPHPSSELPTPQRTQEEATPYAHPSSDHSWNQADQEDDETYLQPTSSVNPTPKPVAKKPRADRAATKTNSRRRSATGRTRARTSSSSQNANKRKAKAKGKSKSKSTTFPVLCQRLENTSALPTIPEETEPHDENDNESQNISTPIADAELDPNHNAPKRSFTQITRDRPSPNAVDILAQFCREYLEPANVNGLIMNKYTAGKTRGASHQHQKLALDSLSSQLETRLTQLSIHVDHRLDLECAVRKSQKDKLAARDHWVQIRGQREAVQHRIDEVKSEIEDRDRRNRRAWELSERLFRVEGEMDKVAAEAAKAHLKVKEKGKEWACSGLELHLTTAAVAPTSRVGKTGLWRRARAFNQVLEDTLAVLDRRVASSSI